MSDTTVVHLLRHAEVSNPRGVLYGRLPGFHLSEEGRLMAKSAAPVTYLMITRGSLIRIPGFVARVVT